MEAVRSAVMSASIMANAHGSVPRVCGAEFDFSHSQPNSSYSQGVGVVSGVSGVGFVSGGSGMGMLHGSE